jgi:hypothetical protein
VFLAVALVAGGLVVGLIVGRWWAVVAPIAFAVWIYKTDRPVFLSGTDLSRGGVATVIGVWGSVAVLVGVAVRRIARGLISRS